MKRNLSTIIILLVCVFLSNAQTLTIERCVMLARENYPLIAQYGLLEKISEVNISNISKGWLPQGSASGQISWQNDVAALPELLTGMLTQNGINYPGLDKTQYRIGIDITQQIWDGGKIQANKQAIKTSTDVKKASLDVQLYDVEGRVEELYFSILLLNKYIRRADKTIALIDSTLIQAKSMFANGVAMKSDCDQIEAKLLATQQQKIQLCSNYVSLTRILELFIGEPIGQRDLVIPAAEITEQQSESCPQTQLFESRLNNIRASELGIKASQMPTVGAFASGYYGYPGYNMFKNMQSRDMSFNFMAGVKVAWNFGSLYTRKNDLNKLELQRKEIETERTTFNFNNNIAILESIGQIDALRDMMRNDEKIVELRQNVLNAAQSQLRNGVIDSTTLLTKITDEELAENDLAQHRLELIKAIHKLNHIKNK